MTSSSSSSTTSNGNGIHYSPLPLLMLPLPAWPSLPSNSHSLAPHPLPDPISSASQPPPIYLRFCKLGFGHNPMESLQHKVESWIKDQRTKMLKVSWGPLQWRIKWPWVWNDDKESRKKIHEEYERRRKQLQDLCFAVKAESVADLQDILCCMVLSECVYKRPAAEVVRFVNKFKADFGGQIVGLERVQPSSDQVPHRYLLAEAGDTLFASFVGTKQYKDLMTDANILQGDLFNEDPDEESVSGNENGEDETHKTAVDTIPRTPGNNSRQIKNRQKPAAHRGFLSRAKGIPALELYKLAQKKKRKLVLCGHSLGGAVAALATLAILRVMAASSSLKGNEEVLVKCITFSQPPVGNAALRDYVNNKGWQHHFKSYCIPEDLVPRILSPAYFHHYNEQLLSTLVENPSGVIASTNGNPEEKISEKTKESANEQLVLGLGPVQTSFWRLARLVPLDSIRRQLSKYNSNQVNLEEPVNVPSPSETSVTDDEAAVPRSLEIEEGSDSISLKPIVSLEEEQSNVATGGKLIGKNGAIANDAGRSWRQVPYLPSYVPFGELYLLGNSSVDSLSGSEYSKLTSVRTVIAELKELFQSHSMKSYRMRFQRIYDLCMGENASCFLGFEQLQQFPNFHELLGLSMAGSVELGHIVEPPAIRTATSIVPLGWRGVPGDKTAKPLKVDITGFGLHSCTLVQAQVNGNWCSTTVESFPSESTNSSDQGLYPDLQKIRVVVGAPLKRPPKHHITSESVMPLFASVDSETVSPSILGHDTNSSEDGRFIRPEGLNDLVVYCTSDFATVSKKVHVRTRRVKLLGLEGSGKTCLLKAILSQGKLTAASDIEATNAEANVQEGIIDGLSFLDSSGVNLQELSLEASRFKDELWTGLCDLSRKIDLIVLVHNLAHSIPRYNKSGDPEQQPALSLLLDEAKALGTPWILAVTNKFAVSAHQQRTAIDAVLQAYRASPTTTEVINSCPYIMPSPESITIALPSNDSPGPQNLIFAPLNFVRRPFLKKAGVLPVQGVNKLCRHIHHVLESQEEACLQELVRDRLMIELARDRAAAAADVDGDTRGKALTMTAAAVGGSLGAGIGIVFAVIMGAASAWRKP